MGWYGANLKFKCQVKDASDDAPLFEESIIIVNSESEFEAREKAQEIGSGRQHSYKK